MSAEGRVEHQKLNQTTALLLCCCLVEFLLFNSIIWCKSDLPKTLNREEYYLICGWPLRCCRVLTVLTVACFTIFIVYKGIILPGPRSNERILLNLIILGSIRFSQLVFLHPHEKINDTRDKFRKRVQSSDQHE